MIVAQSARLGGLARYVGRPLALLFAFDVAVVVAYVFTGWKWLSVPDVPLSLFGGVLGVLAGFRNASAYARWWEARTIWGGIVNSSRTFARQILTMTVATEATESSVDEIRRKLVLLQIAYVHALRHHLRGLPPWDEINGLVPENEIARLRTQKNVPLAIQQIIAFQLTQLHQMGSIDGPRWVNMDRTLARLMDCQGASERIKNTPMPRQYDAFIRYFITVFCLLLPLAMVDDLGLFTPVGSTFVGFMFLALDQIGRDLEAPFENLPHDISLTAISRTIDINLKQMIAEEEIPEPLASIDGVLW
jgi:putative membrane protein